MKPDPLAALSQLKDFTLTFEGTFDRDGFDAFRQLMGDTRPALPDGWRLMRRDEAPEAYDLIAGFRYKMGWSFTLLVPTTGMAVPYLRVLASVPDRDRPLAEVAVEARFAVPLYLADCLPEHLWQWLRSSILEVEAHEVDEWFTVDGVRVFDPHAKKGTPT